jgi:hypothetical protein
MTWVGFEPTILAFERAKTVHASDRAAAVIGAEITGRLIYLFVYGTFNGTASNSESADSGSVCLSVWGGPESLGIFVSSP